MALVRGPSWKPGDGTYKVSQMDMSIRIQEHIVGLDITVNDALAVDVPQCTA